MKFACSTIAVIALFAVAQPALAENTAVTPVAKTEITHKKKLPHIEGSAMTVHATLTAIDYKKRTAELTLADGKIVLVDVSDKIKNIERYKVGDQVAIDIVETITIQIDKDAKAKRRALYENVHTDHPDKKTIITRVKVEELTARIESVDLDKRLVTLALPEGKKQTVHVPTYIKGIDKLSKGDMVAFRFSHATGTRMIKEANVTTKDEEKPAIKNK